MSRSYDGPPLTPQFCFNQTALRDFLRLSRSSIDDSITQYLNALATPAARPFDPSSTSMRIVPPASKQPIEPQKCQSFKDNVLFPSWQTRTGVLEYCAVVATSPDPEDPDAVLRQVEDSKARERAVDERLDPYSGSYFPREARTEALANLIRSERSVESIIRARTWAVIGERCGITNEDADTAFTQWRARQQ